MEICDALREFRFSRAQLTESGGNESEIPKTYSRLLRPKGWVERRLSASLVVDSEIIQQDTHKIDYVKGRVAFDLEWNSSDRALDRNLFEVRKFYDYDRISVGVVLTRSEGLGQSFRASAANKKSGPSTVHMGKLRKSLDTGRVGGCPLLVFGMTEKLFVEEMFDCPALVEPFL